MKEVEEGIYYYYYSLQGKETNCLAWPQQVVVVDEDSVNYVNDEDGEGGRKWIKKNGKEERPYTAKKPRKIRKKN